MLLFSAYFEKTLDSTEHLVLFVLLKDFAALNLLSEIFCKKYTKQCFRSWPFYLVFSFVK